MKPLQAPFPWFGGKRLVADIVWRFIGDDIRNYVEPFFGSGAVLLNRPRVTGTETVNDLDGYVANFWRALKHRPDEVAEHAENPVNENDLHARHTWLVQQRADLRSRLEGDPDFCDARIAGYWVWGLCCWIGGGFCSGEGPWQSVDGKLVRLGKAGRGVKRRLVFLSMPGQGVTQKGIREHDGALREWFHALAARLRHVRVCSGDWSRVCGPAVTTGRGTTAVFLDPPYADTADRSSGIYAEDSISVAHDVREWAIAHGDDPLMRIALCGYEGEHEMPDTWTKIAWKATDGYRSSQGHRERVWFSPHCLAHEPRQRAFEF